MLKALALTSLAVSLFAPLSSAQNSALVEFDAGAQGWSINGLVSVLPAGGNPDEMLDYPDPIDNFGIAVRNSTQAAFLGDYTAKGDVTLSLDMQVDYIMNFGLNFSRELVVILYDDDVQGPSGAARVWSSLGVLNGNGMGWTNFSVDVTDVNSTTLPAGWGGGGDEDPNTFEPILPAGSTWTSVLSGIDRIEFTTLVPGFFFSFAHFDLSADNISIQPIANSAWTDLGFALAGVNGDPALVGSGSLASGSINSVDLSNAAPVATAGIFIGLSAITAPFKGGTLVPNPDALIIVNTDALGEFGLGFHMPAGVPAGVSLFVQMGVQDGAAINGVALSNAIEGVTP